MTYIYIYCNLKCIVFASSCSAERKEAGARSIRTPAPEGGRGCRPSIKDFHLLASTVASVRGFWELEQSQSHENPSVQG